MWLTLKCNVWDLVFDYDCKYKDLVTRTQSDKVLRHEAFEIASNPKYDGYKRRLYKFFDKKSTDAGIKSMSNEQLVNELHKAIIRKFKRRKFFSTLF